MADMAPGNIFEKFIQTRDIKPPTPPKKAKRTIGNLAAAAEAQLVYMEPQGGGGGNAPAGTAAAMGTTGAWGKPDNK
jgi:hypothetical protein